MAGSGRYTIQLDALVNDAKIRAQIAAIQKQINGGAFVAAGGKNGKGGATMIQQTTKSAQKANKELGKMNKALVGTQKAGKGAGLGLLDVTKKVAAFGAVTTVIQGATAGIGDMVKNVFELDAALTEYKKVSDLGQKGIEKMTDSAFKMGRTVAKTGTEMVQAATEFKKSGYSDKDAMKLGRIAMMYTNIADQELSAGEAANFIVSQMKAYNLTASDSEHIIDAVNEVSNNFAVSSTDIATNIGKASAALATGNITYEQSIGLMTAMTEITRNGAKAARGLVSVQSRYNQIVDESSSTGKKLTAWYKEHNIAIKDQNGQLRSFYEVGADVAKIWDTLSDNEKRYYLNTQAGANQSQNLAALMKNYGTAIDATNTALHSNNSASKENEKYKKSLKGSLQDLSSAWEDFSRKMVNSKAVTGVLHGLTGIMRGLSSDFGQMAIKAGAFVLAGVGIAKVFKLLSGAKVVVAGLATSLMDTYRYIMMGNGALTMFGRTAGMVATMMTPIGLAFGGILTALTAGVVIYGKWLEKNDAFTKQNERAVKAAKEYQQAQKDVEATKQRISNIQSEIDTLESKQQSGGLTIKEEERLALLKEQYEVQKKQLELEREIERNKFEKSQTTLGKKGLTTNDFTKYRGKTPDEIWSAKGVENKTDKALYMYNQSMSKSIELREKAIQAQNKYDKALTEEGHTTEELNKLAKRAKNAQSEYSESLGDTNKTLSDLLDEKQKYIDLYGDESKIPKELRGSYKNLNKVIDDNIALSEVSVDNVKDSIKAIKKYGNAMGVTTEKMEDGSTKINRIDFDKFSGALKNAGKGGDEVLDMLQEIGKQNPNAKVTIEGTDYAMSDLRVVNGELQTIDGKVVTSVAAINDQASPQLAKVSKEKKLGTATKKIEQKGYNNVKKKLDNLRGDHNLGTDTKTIVTVRETRHKRNNGKEAHGTRNFYAKGTDDSAIGNAVVNEQGFEIIRDSRTGAMRVANAGQRGSTWLNRGDAVYTHGQSMRMLQKAGLTEADLLQGRSGDVGVYGVRKLEGFKKGKKQTKYNKARDALRAKYDAAVETAEFKQEKYGYSDDWLHAQMKVARATYLKKLKKLNKKYSGVKKSKGLGTDRERDYILSGVYQTSAEKAVEGIEDALAGFEGGDVKYSEVLEKIKAARKKKLISSQEYKEYLAQLKEVYNEEKKEAISKNIELVANNRKTYDDILAQIKKAYKEGRMSAKEYDEFVAELNEAEVERVRNNYENQWDYISQYVQRQIDLEQKNNDVLEAQGELLSATTQKVKVYKEGIGFVYEADERAVKEAQDNLKNYSSVWEQISEIMDDVESQVNLQRAGVLAGGDLVSQVLGAGTNLSTWQNIIGLIGSNVGAYGLADDLNITDPSKINKATTINGQTFNIDNISLPNVSNANDFVAQLQTLAIQASSSRS